MTDAADRLYEQVLVVRCQAGDDVAFAELVRRYERRLRYYVRRLAGNVALADDLLQDVWLAAYQNLPRLRKPVAFRVWLYRIARNATLRAVRENAGHAELIESALAEDVPDRDADLSPEDAARVHAHLAGLRREWREVLLLRYVSDLDYDEIARVTGCPVGTVRSRLHYAKRELRALMGE